MPIYHSSPTVQNRLSRGNLDPAHCLCVTLYWVPADTLTLAEPPPPAVTMVLFGVVVEEEYEYEVVLLVPFV